MDWSQMTVALGVGFTSRADESALFQALEAACGEGAVDVVATAEDKAMQTPLRNAAARLGLSVLPVPEMALKAMGPHVLTCSMRSLSARGVGSVAEAAALAAAGAGARLDGPRAVSADGQVTTAIARSGA
jgi:cobalt-precorrin 5A hydrolase